MKNVLLNVNTQPHGDQLLRLPEVLEIIQVSKTTWYKGMKRGLYPPQVRLGGRRVAWRRSEVFACVAAFNSNMQRASTIDIAMLKDRPIMCPPPISDSSEGAYETITEMTIAKGGTKPVAANSDRSLGATVALSNDKPHALHVKNIASRGAIRDIVTSRISKIVNTRSIESIEKEQREIQTTMDVQVRKYIEKIATIDEQWITMGLTPPSKETIELYLSINNRFDYREMDNLVAEVSKYAYNANSLALAKCAVKHCRLEAMRDLIDRISKLSYPISRIGFMSLYGQLRESDIEYDNMCSLSHSDALIIRELEREKVKSKLIDMSYFPSDWQQQFLSGIKSSPKLQIIGGLMCFAGIKPEELERGVLIKSDANTITVTIPGSKVRTKHEQKSRTFSLRRSMLPDWLSHALSQFSHCRYAADKDEICKKLAILSENICNRRIMPNGRFPLLSAYFFRHALVTDLRAAGWKDIEIAAVMAID